MFFQRVIVIACFFTYGTHKVGHLSVRCHVRPKSRFPAKGLLTGLAGESPLPGVCDQVGLEVRLVGEYFLTEITLVNGLPRGRS